MGIDGHTACTLAQTDSLRRRRAQKCTGKRAKLEIRAAEGKVRAAALSSDSFLSIGENVDAFKLASRTHSVAGDVGFGGGSAFGILLPDPTLRLPGGRQDGRLSRQNGGQMGDADCDRVQDGLGPSERADLCLGPSSSTRYSEYVRRHGNPDHRFSARSIKGSAALSGGSVSSRNR